LNLFFWHVFLPIRNTCMGGSMFHSFERKNKKKVSGFMTFYFYLWITMCVSNCMVFSSLPQLKHFSCIVFHSLSVHTNQPQIRDALISSFSFPVSFKTAKVCRVLNKIRITIKKKEDRDRLSWQHPSWCFLHFTKYYYTHTHSSDVLVCPILSTNYFLLHFVSS